MVHALSKNINCLALDSQVCFHRWLFADPVKPSWCITGPVGPLGSTNQNWLGAKLLPMAVSIHPVVCVHPCRLLRAQYHCLWPNGREGLPSACPPTHPLISVIHDITALKKLSQKLAVNTARAELAIKQWL